MKIIRQIVKRRRAYNLIMKDKRNFSASIRLSPIFSHSALRGWDNPIIFQICTLQDITTERERRQTIAEDYDVCESTR